MVAGPDMIKFAHVLKELGTYNENLRTQIEHTLSDRLLRFGNVELQDIKEVRKRFDKADAVYSHIRDKYLSLRKSTRTEIASATDERDVPGTLSAIMHFEQARFSLVLQRLSNHLYRINFTIVHLFADFSENKSTDADIMFPAEPPTLLSELSNEVGFPVTNTSFDALLESLLSTAKPFPQSAGYRILAS
ncbi:ADP-ribosylation factor GTPase-activating protein AGD3-like protein [Tanacetum coccineum]